MAALRGTVSAWLRRSLGRLTRADLAFAACLLASLGVCTWIVLHVDSRYGDLSDLHTDHIHHVRATWTFWKIGFEVYRMPLGTTTTDVPFPLVPKVTWPDFPVAYPPGMFAVFALPTWYGAHHPELTPPEFARWTVLWVVVLSHVGLVGVWRALQAIPRGGAAPLLVAIWLLTWRMSLHGFYDAVWVGAAAMSVAALARRRPAWSLVWFTLAALINYRAASLAPAAAWAAWSFLRSDARWWRKVLLFATTGAVCLLVLWTFWLFTKGSPPPDTDAYKSAVSPVAGDPTSRHLVWAACGVTAAIALGAGDVLVAITVLFAGLLTIHHAGHAWHGTILIGAGLLVGTTRREVDVPFLRNVVTLWMLGMWELFFFGSTLFGVFGDILVRAKFLK